MTANTAAQTYLPGTTILKLQVSSERLDEWLAFLDTVQPTTQHPLSGDRILSLARAAIGVQERRRPKLRETSKQRYLKRTGKG